MGRVRHPESRSGQDVCQQNSKHIFMLLLCVLRVHMHVSYKVNLDYSCVGFEQIRHRHSHKKKPPMVLFGTVPLFSLGGCGEKMAVTVGWAERLQGELQGTKREKILFLVPSIHNTLDSACWSVAPPVEDRLLGCKHVLQVTEPGREARELTWRGY